MTYSSATTNEYLIHKPATFDSTRILSKTQFNLSIYPEIARKHSRKRNDQLNHLRLHGAEVSATFEYFNLALEERLALGIRMREKNFEAEEICSAT
jgi:hypothetical protein